MSAINSSSNMVHSNVNEQNESVPSSKSDLNEKASRTYRKTIPFSQRSASRTVSRPAPSNVPQFGRDSFGNRSIALEAINTKLHVDEQVKDKLRVSLGHLPVPRVRMDFPGNEGKPTLIVWRGMSLKRLEEIITKGSIGKEADANTSAPTEEEARIQVGDEQQPTLTEFTFDPIVAKGFARYAFARGEIGVIGCVAISGEYVTRGSRSEGGVVCRRGAPMELIAWEPGETIAY